MGGHIHFTFYIAAIRKRVLNSALNLPAFYAIISVVFHWFAKSYHARLQDTHVVNYDDSEVSTSPTRCAKHAENARESPSYSRYQRM